MAQYEHTKARNEDREAFKRIMREVCGYRATRDAAQLRRDLEHIEKLLAYAREETLADYEREDRGSPAG